MHYKTMDRLFIWGVSGLVVFLVVMIIVDIRSPKIFLNKDAWVCTDRKTILVPMHNGQTATVVPQTKCVEYRRK